MQDDLTGRSRGEPAARRMQFRIGINLGEITADEEDIHGDGVNIAARLEGLADPGGIMISANVFEQVRKNIGRAFEDMGAATLKNIAEPVRHYRVRLDGTEPAPQAIRHIRRTGRRAAGSAVLIILLVGLGIAI
jgi:adenylate cyclase